MARQRIRGTIDPSRTSMIPTAHATSVDFRAWSQAVYGNRILLTGYTYKPFHYVYNLVNMDKIIPGYGLVLAYPFCGAAREGPNQISAATFAGTSTTDVIGGTVASTLLAPSNIGPSLNNGRYGPLQFGLQSGNRLTVPVQLMRSCLHFGTPFAVEFVMQTGVGSNWLVLDHNAALTSFAGFITDSTASTINYQDSSGNVVALAGTGTLTAGWHHILIVWDGTQFLFWVDGADIFNAARAAVTTIADWTTGTMEFNYSGGNPMGAIAFYFNPSVISDDWMGLAIRHRDDWFYDFRTDAYSWTSGAVTSFGSWEQVLTRSSNPGIPDVIGVSSMYSTWAWEMQIEGE